MGYEYKTPKFGKFEILLIVLFALFAIGNVAVLIRTVFGIVFG
jgi:hypothetical protein